MTVRNRVLEILQKQQDIDTTAKEVAGVAKEQGLFILLYNKMFTK